MRKKEKVFGVLKINSGKKLKPVKKLIKPNSKKDNAKVVRGLNVYLDEQKRMDEIREENMVEINDVKSKLVEKYHNDMGEWLEVLKLNVDKEIRGCDNPKELMLGFSYCDEGMIFTHYVKLFVAHKYMQKNPKSQIFKHLGSASRYDKIVNYFVKAKEQ